MNQGLIDFGGDLFSDFFFPDGDTGGGFGFFPVTYNSSWIIVNASNVENRGGLTVGTDGLIRLTGNNVNLSQFVTIGSNHGKAAVIGDNVYIGPNCVLVEGITIGNNVTIGAGSVVTRSIPDNCTAAGNPARVLNQNNPGRYITQRWPLQEN